jgi:hypothetical protein
MVSVEIASKAGVRKLASAPLAVGSGYPYPEPKTRRSGVRALLTNEQGKVSATLLFNFFVDFLIFLSYYLLVSL